MCVLLLKFLIFLDSKFDLSKNCSALGIRGKLFAEMQKLEMSTMLIAVFARTSQKNAKKTHNHREILSTTGSSAPLLTLSRIESIIKF